jgi:Spy/CpxP family protein refolding chaperone
MRSRLKLTDKQVDQLEAILDDTKARVKAVRDASRPAMLRIKNEQIARVTSILTPEQVTGYQKLVAERERRAKEQEDQDHSNDDRHQHHRPPSF